MFSLILKSHIAKTEFFMSELAPFREKSPGFINLETSSRQGRLISHFYLLVCVYSFLGKKDFVVLTVVFD